MEGRSRRAGWRTRVTRPTRATLAWDFSIELGRDGKFAVKISNERDLLALRNIVWKYFMLM
jgi:hypothetical protein